MFVVVWVKIGFHVRNGVLVDFFENEITVFPDSVVIVEFIECHSSHAIIFIICSK